MERWKKTFAAAVEAQKELGLYLNKAVHEDMNPLKVLDLFRRISDEDCELLGLRPEFGRPEEFLWQYISVPPVCIRPSVAQDGLTEIVFTNALIKQGLGKGAPTAHVAMYINSELPGVPSQPGQKPIRGFVQRLKGKQGRFRGNLSGKRVDFSGRTVISPDPNLRIDEVAVPERVSKILTYPERVTTHNIEMLKQAVRNGCDVHPGANFVARGDNKKFLKFGNRAAIADGLKYGDVVERHIIDGDIVLFNRQPSLHKVGQSPPLAILQTQRVCCGPYNADFDGDEMNLREFQLAVLTDDYHTEICRTDLMSVKHNLVTPRNGEPVIAAIQDFITASYLLSRRDVFFDRRQFTQIWKQVFNVLMRPNKKSKIFVNVESKCNKWEEAKAENYPSRMKLVNDMSPNDGWLVIVNSEVMCGVMDKAIVGTAAAMGRLANYAPALTSCFFSANFGFSLGINDVIPGPMLSMKKDELVEKAYADWKLENKPGCNQEQTLEAMISSVLSKELSRHNAPLIMATCGSKGSVINVSQMVACVGQQIIAGHRVPDGFQDRSLPHFPKKSKEPPSKGFVRNSFYSGLRATEFLFHAISGREGLVDTAVKTAETGYMQRRLMKALEDLTTQYDLSVRNSTGGVVQFTYGDDGLDPACLEGDAQPIEFQRAWSHAMAIGSRTGRGLLPFEIMEIVNVQFATRRFVETCPETYMETVRTFIWDNVAKKLGDMRQSRGMCVCTPVFKLASLLIPQGSTVGAVGAQSIGEPGTQMTLKTFHFAGEIINAAKVISTPIISCRLVTCNSEPSARIVKGRLEKTLLGDAITMIPRKNRLRIYVDGQDKFYRLREFKRNLAAVVVKGVPTIARAIINIKDKDDRRGKKGVIGEQTTSNHVIEVAQVLGIEAARRTIINEIQYTMKSHDMIIDPRHVMLLGDVMTYKGEVLGITRFGVAKMKDSVMMLASFEKTTDHLFDASAYGKNDSIAGVSESIIMGNPAARCGTSM
ncbi:beta and beta-primes of DNA dependent RNA-polymerase [Salix suchowensis]|nr:beta and beta-primes of DNA dependent RNA-polymerase [Salix suchowensis]